MKKITTTTKPNGSGRNWLEVGHFVDDEFGHSNWIKKGDPNQDRQLTVNRLHSDGGATLDWIILIPENYQWTIVKINYDRLNPRSYQILWQPAASSKTDQLTKPEKIKRIYQLAAGNEELTNLLDQLFPQLPE